MSPPDHKSDTFKFSKSQPHNLLSIAILKSAISEITVLIAGADGNIDDDDISWAKKVTEIRSYKLPDVLRDLYAQVGTTFSDDLATLIKETAGPSEERNVKLSDQLSRTGPLLQKMENQELAAALHDSYLSFAKHVAKSSGGFLSFGSISGAEKKLLDLKMINYEAPQG